MLWLRFLLSFLLYLKEFCGSLCLQWQPADRVIGLQTTTKLVLVFEQSALNKIQKLEIKTGFTDGT